jgi:hypothetical protein
MNEFTIGGKQGFIRIELQEAIDFPKNTSPFGGYDALGIVEIKSGSYYALGELWFTTGEVYQFYQQLAQCFQELNGKAKFWNYESNFKVEIEFGKLGQFIIKGYFKEKQELENELQFEIESEQNYLSSTLSQLKKFVDKYGDLKGKKE